MRHPAHQMIAPPRLELPILSHSARSISHHDLTRNDIFTATYSLGSVPPEPEVDVPLVRRDHGFDVHALDLPVEAGIEPVRPVPDGDGQLLRVGVHADHKPGFVFGAAAQIPNVK